MSSVAITPDQFSTFGELLRHLRRQARLTQRELAIAVGYSDTQISRMEQNQRVPDAATITALFVPALYIEDEPKWVSRLLELAKAVLVDGEPGTEMVAAAPTGTVAFLFTDIEGSTNLARQYPDAMLALLARHHEILKQCIQAHNGYVFQVVGDSFAAAFHSASDALNAALDAQRLLHNEAWSPAPIKVRMGIHTGTAHLQDASKVLRYSGYATLALTQRIMSAGHGGQILLSQSTYELTRDTPPENAQLVDLGQHRLKDALQAEHIYQLTVPDLPSEFPPLNTIRLFNHNLPAQLTSFIGREKEIAEIKGVIEKYRLVTLTGPGGTGKTRLGLQVVTDLLDDFKNGVYFVNLAPISDPNLVASTIAQTLNVKEATGRPLLESLKDYLRSKHFLLLLDNFEQVVSAAPLVAELLASCPQLKVLVTSREVLHLQGEHEFSVPPLALPDPKHLPPLERLSQYEGVELFIQRALAVKHDFAVTIDNAPAIAEICYRLDGLPLAIELAAARIKLFPPQVLLARLVGSPLRLLTAGAQDLPARQQTLRNAIAWSYNLLDENEKILFRRLAVFVGGFTLEGAEAVCNAASDRENDVLEGVASLVDKSLLRQMEGAERTPRFGMLETIREYALERLAACEETEAFRQHHTHFFLAFAEDAEPKLTSAARDMWMARLDAELDNLRAALAWSSREQGELETGLRLVGALGWFWYLSGYLSEGRGWIEGALAQSDAPRRTLARAKALFSIGLLAFYQSDYAEAVAWLGETAAIFREVVDKRRLAYALLYLGMVRVWQGNYAVAATLDAEALAIFQEVGDKWSIALSLVGLGFVAHDQGDHLAARALFEQSLALRQELEDKPGIPFVSNLLAEVARHQGNYEQATSLSEESLALYRELQFKSFFLGLPLLNLGKVACYQGDYARAGALLKEGLTIFWRAGAKRDIARGLEAMAELACAQRQFGRATQLLAAAVSLRQAVGAPLPLADQGEYNRTVAVVHAQLDEATLAAAWAQGRVMMLEQAIEYALEENHD